MLYEYFCPQCRTPFQSDIGPHRKDAPRYCSVDCANEARRRNPIRDCLICGKTFKPAHRNRKYCSIDCRSEAHRREGIINCRQCGKPFKRDNRAIMFCSARCYGDSMLAIVPRKGKDFTRAMRLRIRERDNNCCVLCGSTKKLEIDHIIPASLGGDNSLWNGQVLCSRCHKEKSLRQRKIIMRRWR